MRLLLDQDVYTVTVSFLQNIGHDVVRVAELGLARASDKTLLETADQLQRILVTRDRDYGNLVFVHHLGVGVVYLRMRPNTIDEVHTELASVLDRYSEAQLQSAFIVVNDNGHRFRDLR